MDIQAEKHSLIAYINQIEDVTLVDKLKQFVKANEEDFWNDLTDTQKQEIKQGMDELDRSEKFDLEEVLAKHR